MKKYFIFRFKDNLKLIILFSVIALITTYAYTSGKYINEFNYSSIAANVRLPKDNPIEIITTIALVLSIIIPIFEFQYRMRKLTVDHLYSLPIKRERIFLTHYFVGFLEIMIPVTVSFFYSLLSFATKKHIFEVKYFIIYYFTLYLSVFIIYSFITFIFMRANTVRDGIFNIIFGFFFFVCVFWLIEKGAQTDSVIRKIDSTRAMCINPISTLCDYFQTEMEWAAIEIATNLGYYKNNPVANFALGDVLWLIFNFVIAIASFILSIILVKKDKSEDSMGISTSWFSYKTMIPFYMYFFSCISVYTSVIIYFFIAIGGYILYVIYRRNVKIKLYDLGILFGSIILGVITGLLIY